MKVSPVIPAPNILIGLLDAPDEENRKLAAHFLFQLLHETDPLLRWGTADYLLHAPVRLYLGALVKELQEEDQPEENRRLGKLLEIVPLGQPPATYAVVMRVYARVRLTLQILCSLQREPVNLNERRG